MIFEDSEMGPKMIEPVTAVNNDMFYVCLKLSKVWADRAIEGDYSLREMNKIKDFLFPKTIKQFVRIESESASGFEEVFMNKERPCLQPIFDFVKARLTVKWNKSIADTFI